MDPLEALDITQDILKLVAELDEFKGRWQALGTLAPDRLSALRRVATIESVGSSTRIEGAKLTDEEVDRLLSGLDVRSFRSRDEQEVAGYAEVMELVFESWRDIPLTENHLQQLHAVLLKYSDKDERHRGHYKQQPNHVEAFDAEGRSLGVVFQTDSPFDTPRLMEELVRWTSDALAAGTHHPLLIVSVFVVRFLAVHPFQDGNGRLARVLTTLLLLRAGYTYVPFSSLERVIEENKDEYYRTLRRAQMFLDQGESQLGGWDLLLAALPGPAEERAGPEGRAGTDDGGAFAARRAAGRARPRARSADADGGCEADPREPKHAEGPPPSTRGGGATSAPRPRASVLVRARLNPEGCWCVS